LAPLDPSPKPGDVERHAIVAGVSHHDAGGGRLRGRASRARNRTGLRMQHGRRKEKKEGDPKRHTEGSER
jgi:hypothetical protein